MLTLYKMQDGDVLVIVGHFSRYELQELKREGYREYRPNTNKHGIPVQ